MEAFGLLLGTIKLALEIFKDERGDRYSRLLNELLDIEKEYNEELAVGDDNVSDLALGKLRRRFIEFQKRLHAEAGNR